jgi:hypothetical protein
MTKDQLADLQGQVREFIESKGYRVTRSSGSADAYATLKYEFVSPLTAPSASAPAKKKPAAKPAPAKPKAAAKKTRRAK